MINTQTCDVNLSKTSGDFEEISDLESASVSGGFWQVAIPIAVMAGISIYEYVANKRYYVGYDSEISDGAQRAVQKSKSGKGLFGWGFLGL